MTSDLFAYTNTGGMPFAEAYGIPSESEGENFFTAESPRQESEDSVQYEMQRLNTSESLSSVAHCFHKFRERLKSKSVIEFPAKISSNSSIQDIEDPHEESFFSVRSSIMLYEYIEGAMGNSPIASKQSSPILPSISREGRNICPIPLSKVPRTFDVVLSPPNEDGVRIRSADNLHYAPIDFQKEEETFIRLMVSDRLEDLCQDGAKLKCVERKKDGFLHVIEYTRKHLFIEEKAQLAFGVKDLGKLLDLEKPGSREFVTILTKNGEGETEERTYVSNGSHPALASIASGFFNAFTQEEALMQSEKKEVEDNPFLGIIAAGTMTLQKKAQTQEEKERFRDSLQVFFAGSSGRYGAILDSQIPPHLNISVHERREWWEDYKVLSRSCIDL